MPWLKVPGSGPDSVRLPKMDLPAQPYFLYGFPLSRWSRDQGLIAVRPDIGATCAAGCSRRDDGEGVWS
jgi:hypothetical protein